MQLSNLAAAAATPSTLSLYNLAVLRTSELDVDGNYTVDTLAVPFTNEPGDAGFEMRSKYVPSGIQVNARQFMASPREAAARAALADAITGSGLVQQMQESTFKGKPDVGLTRIYLDRRARFIEFPNTAVPAAAQAVLDAIAAYRAIAGSYGVAA